MASLSDRLKSAQPNRSSKVCKTCEFWAQLKPATKQLINDWLDNQYSITQLHDILSAPNDDPTEPRLNNSVSGFKFHLKHHDERCRDN